MVFFPSTLIMVCGYCGPEDLVQCALQLGLRT